MDCREYQRSLKNVKAASGVTGAKGVSGAPVRRVQTTARRL